MKPRRKKGRHREMNKNNPFSGEKECFVKRQKRKEGFRANFPKPHVQGCVDPTPKKKRRKEQNTKRREGSFKRSLFKFAKTVSKEEPRKTQKNPPHRSRKAICGNRSDSSPKRDTPAHQKFHKLVLAREKWGKRHFQNDLSSAATSRFLVSKSNLVKNSNFLKNKFVRPPKIILKKFVQHRGDTKRPT